jgi:hypothetical protein
MHLIQVVVGEIVCVGFSHGARGRGIGSIFCGKNSSNKFEIIFLGKK